MTATSGHSTGTRATAGPARVLVTGGAGFIGTNLVMRLLEAQAQVRILDCLARAGSESNVDWLASHYPGQIDFIRGDVRDRDAVRGAVQDMDHIFHLAAQVAVTTSLLDPLQDFAVNAQGTLNLLEAARTCKRPPSLLFTSTNKVYGALNDIEVVASAQRYQPIDEHTRAAGIGETRNLEFHSPYGCSKGAAEQYVLDYARSFGLSTVVMRMSCIYGPHQHGNEDQGWVAHFLKRALADEPVVVYGTGCQVRDVLFVDDLIDAFELARLNIHSLSGRAFNIGGGTTHTLSVLELLNLIERMTGRAIQVSLDEWRIGDQRYYVSDTARFRAATGWRPHISVRDGLNALHQWLSAVQAEVPSAGHGVEQGMSLGAKKSLWAST